MDYTKIIEIFSNQDILRNKLTHALGIGFRINTNAQAIGISPKTLTHFLIKGKPSMPKTILMIIKFIEDRENLSEKAQV